MTLRDDLLAPTSPAATAGLRHRAAEWSYGDKEQCRGAYLYALDLTPPSETVAEAAAPEVTGADDPVVVVETPAPSTLQ